MACEVKMKWKMLPIIVLLIADCSTALAAQSYCARVTEGGLVALRQGPGIQFPIINRLLPQDLVLVDTGSSDGQWTFIKSVARIDGADPRKFTRGWVASNLIQETPCPGADTHAFEPFTKGP
jgi:hypothetical protein